MVTNNTSDARTTVVINNELLRLKFDIAALQETRLADQRSIREKEFTSFWHGKSADELREHGVGFAVKNTLLQSVEVGSDGNKTCFQSLFTKKGTVTLISLYSHKLCAIKSKKMHFVRN